MAPTVELPQLNFPDFRFKIKRVAGNDHIFDPVRKKYLVLTPEEWVRQHMIAFLTENLGCPLSLIATEMSLKLNGMSRRSDVVVHNTNGVPRLIVECKAPEVKITQAAFDQIARYNMVLRVDFLVVTNGYQHFCCQLDYERNSYRFLEGLPNWEELKK